MKQSLGLFALMGIGIAASDAVVVSAHSATPSSHCALKASHRPQTLHYLGDMQFDAFTDDSIQFAASEGDRTDPVLYDARTDNFHYDGLYRLRNASGQWQFRIGAQEFGTHTRFFHVQWEQGRRPQQAGIYTVEALKQPAVIRTGAPIAMVGDSITWAGYGQRLRCEMLDAGFSGHFVGRHVDSFGLAHEGEGGNTTADLMRRLENVPASSRYFLLIGTNDVTATPKETLDNILHIAGGLSHARKAAKVYVSTLLPRSDNKAANRRNDAVNELLRAHFKTCTDCQSLVLVDTAQVMHEHGDWQSLLVDGLHPSIEGYRFLAKYWVQEIR
jgi:lysophospholipase L1-like esterase